MPLCCVTCGGFSLTTSGPAHTITDATGRAWRFELHHYCGPIVLRQDGEPKTRQPGSRSPFWPAFEAWSKARNEEA
jgi:hypothetical protein